MKKTILITGASSGIGKATALELGRIPEIRLILISRDQIAGERIGKQIEKHNAASKVDTYPCDLSSISQVESLSQTLLSSYPKIDVLINNAGARFDHYKQSEDGIELTFATNHLGHFALANRLLGLLLKSSAPRIINVSSSAHRQARPEIGWNCAQSEFDRKIAYANSKLANILFTQELGRKLHSKEALCFAVDPGPTASGFARNNGLAAWVKHLLSHKLKGDLRSTKRGADTIIHLATAPLSQAASGWLYRDRQIVEPSPLAMDPDLSQKLWFESERLIQSISRNEMIA